MTKISDVAAYLDGHKHHKEFLGKFEKLKELLLNEDRTKKEIAETFAKQGKFEDVRREYKELLELAESIITINSSNPALNDITNNLILSLNEESKNVIFNTLEMGEQISLLIDKKKAEYGDSGFVILSSGLLGKGDALNNLGLMGGAAGSSQGLFDKGVKSVRLSLKFEKGPIGTQLVPQIKVLQISTMSDTFASIAEIKNIDGFEKTLQDFPELAKIQSNNRNHNKKISLVQY